MFHAEAAESQGQVLFLLSLKANQLGAHPEEQQPPATQPKKEYHLNWT